MAKKGYTPEQIINKLREAEILLQQGATIAESPGVHILREGSAKSQSVE